MERTAEAGESDGGGNRVRRGWIQGDSLEVKYRGRLGELYQVIVGEYGGMRSEDDGAVRLSDSDLWKETRHIVAFRVGERDQHWRSDGRLHARGGRRSKLFGRALRVCSPRPRHSAASTTS